MAAGPDCRHPLTGPALIRGAVAALLVATAAAGQQRANERTPAQPYSLTVEVVRVPVVVIDGVGAFIDGLGPGDFHVVDGGEVHSLSHFVSEREPTTVGIVLASGDRTRPRRLRQAAALLVGGLQPADELFLVAAGGEARLLAPPARERPPLTAVLEGYRPASGPGALYDAVALGLSVLRRGAHEKRALVLVGAGDGRRDPEEERGLIHEAQRLGVTIHGIITVEPSRGGDGPAASAPGRGARGSRRWRQGTIGRLAAMTGGLVAAPPVTSQLYDPDTWLQEACADICRYLNHQYLLHYTPRDPPPPGVWRDITVQVRVPFKEVRSRSGYVR